MLIGTPTLRLSLVLWGHSATPIHTVGHATLHKYGVQGDGVHVAVASIWRCCTSRLSPSHPLTARGDVETRAHPQISIFFICQLVKLQLCCAVQALCCQAARRG